MNKKGLLGVVCMSIGIGLSLYEGASLVTAIGATVFTFGIGILFLFD